MIVEASGVAEPSRLGAISGAWLGTEARGIVVVADAATLRDRVDDRFVGDLVRRQLDSADTIVLNKSDLREPDRLVDVATWLDNDSNRELLVTSRGRVGFPTLLAARSRSFHTGPEVPHAAALPRFSTVTIENTRCWSRMELEHALDALHSTIVRVKGRVRVEDASQPTVVQAVGAAWVLDEFPEPPATANQLVFVSSEACDDLKTRSRPFC